MTIEAWHVRQASAADLGALSLVGAATFFETFAGLLDGQAIVDHCVEEHSRAAYGAYLESEDCAAWLAEAADGGAPLGYALLSSTRLPASNPRYDIELKRIYVLSRFHGTGLGRALMHGAVEHARAKNATRLLLGVFIGNRRAIAFYRSSGFTQIATRRFKVGGSLYEDIVLAKSLKADL